MAEELSLGAIVRAEGVAFRVWAPRPERVELALQEGEAERRIAMRREEGGYWTAFVDGAGAGARYGYVLDSEGPFPDPCSRSQPEGVHGLSEVVDPAAFPWTDGEWAPPPYEELVIYEAHVGTLTRAGTFDAAIDELPRLRALGVTAVELMPVASFPGNRNWGYDGVALYAPSAAYGGPEGLRRFVDAAHANGLAVILDVVYNHFGPDGNYTGLYSNEYITEAHQTPWGGAINFDGPGSTEVRRFYRENLLHWLREYHLDGFRFDATHAIIDGSPRHVLAELAEAVEGEGQFGRRPYLVAESHENDVRYLRPIAEGGFGFDGVWADDFHHVIRTALAHDHEGYYAAFDGSMDEIARTIRQGFLYEGQVDAALGHSRGTEARDVPWPSFVYCLQNHDQVGNRAFGDRLTVGASHARVRAATLLLLLLPQTPLLFQGQEVFAPEPFLYFTDHTEELGRLVTEGRRHEFAGFSAFGNEHVRERIPDPQAPETFFRSQLALGEEHWGLGGLTADFHRALLQVRRDDPVLGRYRRDRLPIETDAQGRAVWARMSCSDGERWLVANFGERQELALGLPRAAKVDLHTGEGRFGGNAAEPRIDGGALVVPPETGVFVTLPGS